MLRLFIEPREELAFVVAEHHQPHGLEGRQHRQCIRRWREVQRIHDRTRLVVRVRLPVGWGFESQLLGLWSPVLGQCFEFTIAALTEEGRERG